MNENMTTIWLISLAAAWYLGVAGGAFLGYLLGRRKGSNRVP